jgi:hypothetical protein
MELWHDTVDSRQPKYRYSDILRQKIPLTKQRGGGLEWGSGDWRKKMAETKQERVVTLSDQLGDLQVELRNAERSVQVLRQAREIVQAEIVRQAHGIALGDTIAWPGEQRLRNRPPRPITLRGTVIGVPSPDHLLVQRVNRNGEPMDQALCVPVSVALLL